MLAAWTVGSRASRSTRFLVRDPAPRRVRHAASTSKSRGERGEIHGTRGLQDFDAPHAKPEQVVPSGGAKDVSDASELLLATYGNEEHMVPVLQRALVGLQRITLERAL